MAFPTKTCVLCGEEFELRPDHPGYANRCRSCNEPEANAAPSKSATDAFEGKARAEANAERRRVMRDMLYRKDS